MEVSWNRGTPKSSILMGFSLINQPFWGTPFMETPIWVADLWSLSGDHCSMARFRWNFHDQWTGRALKALARYPAGKIHPLKSALIFKGLMYYPESPNWLRKKEKKHHIWMLKPVFSPSKNLDPQATACRHSLELSPQRIPPFHVEDAEKMQKRCSSCYVAMGKPFY